MFNSHSFSEKKWKTHQNTDKDLLANDGEGGGDAMSSYIWYHCKTAVAPANPTDLSVSNLNMKWTERESLSRERLRNNNSTEKKAATGRLNGGKQRHVTTVLREMPGDCLYSRVFLLWPAAPYVH